MLQERAMLANLTIHAWTARKQDKKVSREVEQNHGASDAGNFNKMLIDKNALQPLSQHSGRVRDYHYTMTLPWGDNGDRLLPSTAYFDYTTQMRNLRLEQERLADDFAQNYPTLVQTARNKLGSMYDPSDYPPVDEIRRRFSIELSFLPVPDANDFRVDVGTAAVEEIRKNISAQVQEREREAIKECWNRLYDVVSKIETMMNKEKPIFRNSLIDNARDLVTLLPKLNITNDVDLVEVCGLVEAKLLVDPQRLRNSRLARQCAAKESADILHRICAHK